MSELLALLLPHLEETLSELPKAQELLRTLREGAGELQQRDRGLDESGRFEIKTRYLRFVAYKVLGL